MTAPAALSNPLDLIGNTPLVLLQGPSEAAGCEIWGKCEFMNPGASVKDRAALWIIRDAETRGELAPGGTIVEGTAGNTGIGLALVANARGYKTVIVMPAIAPLWSREITSATPVAYRPSASRKARASKAGESGKRSTIAAGLEATDRDA